MLKQVQKRKKMSIRYEKYIYFFKLRHIYLNVNRNLVYVKCKISFIYLNASLLNVVTVRFYVIVTFTLFQSQIFVKLASSA